jgi:hypothetical protein
MSRARLGSLLGLLCSALLLWSLLIVVDPYPPRPYFEWSLCGVLFTASVGLWFNKNWARITFLVAGSIFVLFSIAATAVGFACAGNLVYCYQNFVRSEPLFADIYYFVQVACVPQSLRCYTSFIYLQPVLTGLALALLVWPLASNNRSRGA